MRRVTRPDSRKPKGLLDRLNHSRALKRAIDLGVAGGGLVALSPVLGAVVAANVVAHGWPPFFVQRRPGKGGRIFRLIKLRSMRDARGRDGRPLPDAERLTNFGKLLRASSVDELPELWNVVRGEMSLVGPRPLLVEYLERYSPEQARRHEVLPGITGWAQINGRNAISWEEKFAADVWYVDHWSNALDLQILFRTIKQVLVRDGISAEGNVTMPVFMGAEAPAARPTA